MDTLRLEELFQHQGKPGRKEYVHYRDRPICGPEQHMKRQTLVVNLRTLAAALCGDSVWASDETERSQETFKPSKYDRAVRDVRSEKAIFMPWLTFREGRTRVMDGRHRLYALIDAGYTHARVVFESEIAMIVQTLADSADLPASAAA